MNRVVRLSAVLLLATLLLAACNSAPTGEPTEVTSAAPRGQGDALTRGLQAHVDGDFDVAIGAYQQVLTDDPNNKLALYNLGQVHQSQGNNTEAEDCYRQTLEVDPEYTPALFNLAILRTAVGDNEEAVQLYKRVVEIDENNAGAYLNMGFALQQLGRDGEAKKSFERALDIDPELRSRLEEG